MWLPVTAGEFAVRVAAGLIAAGIRAGDRVGLMSSPSLDWAVCDFAIWARGVLGRTHQAVPHPGRHLHPRVRADPIRKVRRDYVLATYASDVQALYA